MCEGSLEFHLFREKITILHLNIIFKQVLLTILVYNLYTSIEIIKFKRSSVNSGVPKGYTVPGADPGFQVRGGGAHLK